jgi:hypothetical protein
VARIRCIKPEFPQSESMGRVSRDARLLFIQLWTICDDEGRTRAASRMLASLLYPYDDDAPRLIDGWLGELEAQGCIVRYQVDGQTYVQVCKWLEHQRIDRPSKSKFPEFDESSRAFASNREDSRTFHVGREGKGKERKDREEVAPLPSWLPVEPWNAWLEVRTKKKIPNTARALSLAVGTLEKLRADGQDPTAVLEAATLKGWRGLFPVAEGQKPVAFQPDL